MMQLFEMISERVLRIHIQRRPKPLCQRLDGDLLAVKLAADITKIVHRGKIRENTPVFKGISVKVLLPRGKGRTRRSEPSRTYSPSWPESNPSPLTNQPHWRCFPADRFAPVRRSIGGAPCFRPAGSDAPAGGRSWTAADWCPR